MFIGRKRELEQLNAFYEGNQCRTAVVRGSLGMGKTTLLRHFMRDKDSVYFCAYETTGQQEISLFSQALGMGEQRDMESNVSLETLLDEITRRGQKGKLLLMIDGYPCFAKAEAGFNATLFSYVTGAWADLPIKLILCGDAFLLMDKYVCGKKAPWKGHIDLMLQLQGMGFLEAKNFFAYAQPEERARLYGISGGIPGHMVRLREREASPRQAVELLFDSRPGRASLLPEQIMGTELRELSYYNCILSVMAQGANRVNQLSEAVGKPKDVIVPYLNALMSIGVVRKENAITEETNRKKTRYSIVNSNVVFWYRYLVANRNLYLSGQWDRLWEECIEPDLNCFMQQVFIAISREYMEEKSREGRLPFVIERSGNWWNNDDEAGTTDGFDVVSLGKSEGRSSTIFTLCFYQDTPVEMAELKGLIDKTKQLHREGAVFYVACSRGGFHENTMTAATTIKNILLFHLEDMCG